VDSYVPDNSSVIIISDEVGFTVGVTEMTLFFMMLSFTQGISRHSVGDLIQSRGNPREVTVYDPPHHMRSVTHGTNSSRKFGLFVSLDMYPTHLAPSQLTMVLNIITEEMLRWSRDILYIKLSANPSHSMRRHTKLTQDSAPVGSMSVNLDLPR
jgi:hypothetical protein